MASSPYINRFLSPDSIIPSAANPQSWNRFSYVQNNPIGYSDPTGHQRKNDGDGGSLSSTPSEDDYCDTHPKDCDEKPDDSLKKKGGGGKPLASPNPSSPDIDIVPSDVPEWCEVLDCVLSGLGFLASAFTFAPPPFDLIATVVDVIVTIWSVGRTETDFSYGKISNTRRWLLNGSAAIGLAPAWLGPMSGFIGAGASILNLLITATGIPN